MDLLMGIDVGTSGVKILLVGTDGGPAGETTIEYPLLTPKPGWAEQHPDDWWNATRTGIRALLRKSRVDPARIRAIGLTGQMHGAVFLDKDGRVLHPAILWCDQRTAAECAEITARVGREKVFALTCNPVLTGFQAPKILWLAKNRPALFRKVRRVLLPKDYIRLRLSGVCATDVSDASGTSLFDVRKRRWSDEILRALDIPGDFLPPAFESPEITGGVSPEAARATGLRAGTPIAAGGGDQAAGGVGNGIVAEGLVSVTIGTSGVVFAHADKVKVDPKGRLHTFCHAVPGAWHLMGVMLSAGGSFRWFRDVCCAGEAAAARAAGRDPYELIAEAAAAVPPGCEGLVFLPYLAGERCPHPDPSARGCFIGLSLRHTRAHMARAVMEGVSFGLRDAVAIMEEIGLPLGKKFRVSGGGARSPLWRRIQADIFGRTVVRLSSEQGPSLGAAILAGVGTGVFPDVPAACRRILRETDADAPDRKDARAYAPVYAAYRSLYPALRDGFDTLARIG